MTTEDRMRPKDYGWNKCGLNKAVWSAAVDNMIGSKWMIALGHDFQHKFL